MIKRSIWICVLGSALSNCAPHGLSIAHDTVLGINAKVNNTGTQGQLVVGYDRKFGTVIPTDVEDPTRPGETNAMALVNCTRLVVDGIYLDEYSDFTATGLAAETIAANPGSVRAATSCDQLISPQQKSGAGQ